MPPPREARSLASLAPEAKDGTFSLSILRTADALRGAGSRLRREASRFIMSQTSGSPAAEFAALLAENRDKPAELARFLDPLSHEQRVEVVRSLGRAQQKSLWEVVDGFAPVRLVELVPPQTPELQQVRHVGKNTLPAFTHFEKRLCRLPGSDPEAPDQLAGANFQTMSPVTGPGYFLAFDCPDRAEVLIDYRKLPDRHPDGWPEIRSNEKGLSRFVYGFMVDTLRRVSEHVTIGSAARDGKELGSWFTLCQEPL
jgi:hypothetical protein